MVVFLLVLAVFLGLCSILFSASEVALFSLREPQIKDLKNQLPKSLKGNIDLLLSKPRRLLSMILLADTLVNVSLGLVCLYLVQRFSATFVLSRVGFWVTALLLFAVIVGLCDLLPKISAIQNPTFTARLSLRIFSVLRPVLNPLSRALQHFIEKLVDWVTPQKFHTSTLLTEGEFESIVAYSTKSGTLDQSESEMIQEIIKLGGNTAHDIMTPRIDMAVLADDLTNEEVTARLYNNRLRKIPVYGETPDHLLGVLDVKQFLERTEASLGYLEFLNPPNYVSDTMPAIDLMHSLLRKPQALAIVIDEFGGIEGVVTLDDFFDEVLLDAMPAKDEELYIEIINDTQIRVSGDARLEDIAELKDFLIMGPVGIDTVSGFIFNRLGYVPKAGTVVTLPEYDITLTVRKATPRRILEVLMEKTL